MQLEIQLIALPAKDYEQHVKNRHCRRRNLG